MRAARRPPAGTMKLTERVRAGSGRMSGGPILSQKAMNFGPSAKRMLDRMAPERRKATVVVVLALVSVALFAIGPRILGWATDLIFAGLFGKQLPPGVLR